jgi:hypothetical protein
MNTSLTIIPLKIDERLTFANVISGAEKTISQYLQQYQFNITVKIAVKVHQNDEAYVKKIEGDEKFIWEENEYAFFMLDKSKTGIEAYCNKLSDTLEYWPKYLEETCGKMLSEKQIHVAKALNMKWYFKRTPGQAVLSILAYGHLAAAVARLTDGVISSQAVAGEDLPPSGADVFISKFFHPDKMIHENSKKWVEKNLNKLRGSAPPAAAPAADRTLIK